MRYGMYEITDDYKVFGIITDKGEITFDPFESSEIIPTWGVYCTTFWGLNEANRMHLTKTLPKEILETIQTEIFWVFWFADTSLSDQKELFFFHDNGRGISCTEPKREAYAVLNIFNSLLEANVSRLLRQTINDLKTLTPITPTK